MTLRLNSSEYIGDTYELKNQKDDKNKANNFYQQLPRCPLAQS